VNFGADAVSLPMLSTFLLNIIAKIVSKLQIFRRRGPVRLSLMMADQAGFGIVPKDIGPDDSFPARHLKHIS
jgi:hypothetical protein